MAHSVSARKRVRQNETRRARNRWRLRAMREAIKDFQGAVAAEDKAEATEAFRKATSVIDRTVKSGVIHKNQGARRKSRLSAKLKALG